MDSPALPSEMNARLRRHDGDDDDLVYFTSILGILAVIRNNGQRRAIMLASALFLFLWRIVELT